MNKQEILAKLAALPYERAEYWVITGAAMVLYGIREETHDIDLGCSAALADRLEAEGFLYRRTGDGLRWFRYGDSIELFEGWLRDRVGTVEGFPVISIDGLLQMKRELGREKELKDIELIRAFREAAADTAETARRAEHWFPNAYFITGSAYAGKSTMVKLLAERHGGVACEENYHDRLLPGLDPAEFPCLTYTRDLEDWHDFIRRTPEEYDAWIEGVSKECELLELGILEELDAGDRPVFVDTNICVETLRRIAPHDHILIMLADPEISVRRFFDRPDREKQFLYRLIMEEPDPEKAMENYRRGLMLINSPEKYARLLHSGFNVLLRDENRSVEQTLALAEKAFGLAPTGEAEGEKSV